MKPVLTCVPRFAGLLLMLPVSALLGCQRGAPPQGPSPSPALNLFELAQGGEPGAKRLRELVQSDDRTMRLQAFGQLVEMVGEKSLDMANRKAGRAALATFSVAELRQCQKECLESPPRLNHSALTPTDFEWWSLLFEVQPELVDQALPLLLERNDPPATFAQSLTQAAYAIPGKRFEHWLATVPQAPWKDDAQRVAAFEGIFMSVSKGFTPKDASWVKDNDSALKYPSLKQRIQGADAAHWSAWAAMWLRAEPAKGDGTARLHDAMLENMTGTGLFAALPAAVLEDAFLSPSPTAVGLAVRLLEKPPRWAELDFERLVKCLQAREWKPRPTLENPWMAGRSWRAMMALSYAKPEQTAQLFEREEVKGAFVDLSGSDDEVSALIGLQVLDGLKILERNRAREELLCNHWHLPQCRAALLLRVEGEARDDLKSLYDKYDAARPAASSSPAREAFEGLGRVFATTTTLGVADLRGFGVFGALKPKPIPWKVAALPAWRDATGKFKNHPDRRVAAVAQRMQTLAEQAR